ncbi:MAG: hypothetical protein CRN43_21505 [Candidatus Nephrothrix sp. EaCA]|nr:MAG: hypothetical protein CRN43_21505 [Candidatus Nephrothrix sp. EaCA]
MKKVSFLILLTVLAVTGKLAAQSESYTPWQVDWTLGFASPAGGEGAKGGLTFYVEPKFHINDHITVGIRAGAAALLKAPVDTNGKAIPGGSFSAAGIGSYLATGNYYFQFSEGGKFRPFAGIGLGYASAAGVSADSNAKSAAIEGKSGFGGMARVGFDVSHFCFNVEYTINPKTAGISNNYLGFNLGFYLGGGSQK